MKNKLREQLKLTFIIGVLSFFTIIQAEQTMFPLIKLVATIAFLFMIICIISVWVKYDIWDEDK